MEATQTPPQSNQDQELLHDLECFQDEATAINRREDGKSTNHHGGNIARHGSSRCPKAINQSSSSEYHLIIPLSVLLFPVND